MTIWENRTLRAAREAAAAAAAADDAWREHKHRCVKCERAQRKRELNTCCGDGWTLYVARREANSQLADERELAKRPVPGQDALFSELGA